MVRRRDLNPQPCAYKATAFVRKAIRPLWVHRPAILLSNPQESSRLNMSDHGGALRQTHCAPFAVTIIFLMAILPESFKAFQFQSGLEIVRDSFRASNARMAEACQKATDAHLDYVASGDDDREYDEDGILVRSKEHELSYESMNAGIASSVVREAFITSAFHYWERSARGWTGLNGKHDVFPVLSKAAGKLYTLHPRLPVLNILNNLLKHNSSDNAEKLAVEWPSVFRPLFPPMLPVDKPVRRLAIRDAHVEEAFAIVAASGPQYE